MAADCMAVHKLISAQEFTPPISCCCQASPLTRNGNPSTWEIYSRVGGKVRILIELVSSVSLAPL
ncbi:MAG: hypothetical protein HQL69_23285 [Magnetococcales bacterium]|nr:hypothetical protein [Magnetococcales bacterium]